MHRLPVIFLSGIIVLMACNGQPGNTNAEVLKNNTGPDSTLNALRDSIDQHQDTSQLYFRYQLAEYYYNKENYKEAMKELDSMLLSPINVKNIPGIYSQYLNAKGLTLEHIGDTTTALKNYEELIALSNGEVPEDFLFHLADLYAEKENAKAITICNDLERNPELQNRVMPPFIRGIYYSNIKDYTNAIKQFDLAISKDYTYADSYIEKGLVYYDQQKYAQAQKVFEKSLEINSAYADAYFWIARCQQKLNQNTGALNNYKRALALDTSITEARQAIKELEQ